MEPRSRRSGSRGSRKRIPPTRRVIQLDWVTQGLADDHAAAYDQVSEDRAYINQLAAEYRDLFES